MTPNNDDALVEAMARAMIEAGDPRRCFRRNPHHEEELRIVRPIARAALTAHRNYKGE